MKNFPRALLLILAGYVTFAIYYSITTPLFEAPDEHWHFAFVRHVAVQRELPIVNPSANQPWAQQGTQAPLYYVLGAPLIAWMDHSELGQIPLANPFARIGKPEAASNDNRNALIHTKDDSLNGVSLAARLLRMYSILFGAVAVTLTYLLAREIFPGRVRLALAATAFVAFLPQFLFITGAISNDNLATALAGASLLLMARVLRRGIETRRAVLLGLCVGGALLAKSNTLGLVPLTLLVIFWRTQQERAPALKPGAIFLGIVTLVGGWWHLRNWQLYGDVFALVPGLEIVGQRAVSPNLMRWLISESEGLRLSTWGVFGWMNILAAPWFYFFFDAFAVVGITGIILALVRKRDLSARVVLLVFWCGALFAALAQWNAVVSAAQGRLLFPALAAYAILWAWGITQFSSWVTKTIVVAQATLAALAPVLFIAPAYTPIIVAPSALPSHVQTLGWQFENGSEWIAAQIDRDVIRTGESFNVTLYQRAPALLSPSTALFVHIVNSANAIIAQRDSLIASANWQTLQSGNLVADSFRVTIPITLSEADTLQIRAGVYDRANQRRLSATDRAGKRLDDAPILAPARLLATDAAWNFDFDGRTRLVRAKISPNALPRGEWIHVILHWSAAPQNYRVFARVLGSDAQDWGFIDTDLEKEMGFFIRVKTKTPPDVYPIELGVYPASDGTRLAIYDPRGTLIGDRLLLGPVRVTAP